MRFGEAKYSAHIDKVQFNEVDRILRFDVNSTFELVIKGYDPANPYAIAPDENMITVAAEEQAEYKTIPQTEKALSKI